MLSFLSTHPMKSTCATISAAVGSVTLSGVLSAVASVVAIVVGGLQIYDWIQRKRKE